MAEKTSLPQGHGLIPWADSTLLPSPIHSGQGRSAVPGHVFCPSNKNKSISLYPDSRGYRQLRITGAVQPGGAAPSRTTQGFSIGVVQGFSMPRMGCGKPGRVVHALAVWATLWATLWERPEPLATSILNYYIHRRKT